MCSSDLRKRSGAKKVFTRFPYSRNIRSRLALPHSTFSVTQAGSTSAIESAGRKVSSHRRYEQTERESETETAALREGQLQNRYKEDKQQRALNLRFYYRTTTVNNSHSVSMCSIKYCLNLAW